MSSAMQAAISGALETPMTASMRAFMDAARSHDSAMGRQLSMLDTMRQHMALVAPWVGLPVRDYADIGFEVPANAISESIRQSALYSRALETAQKLGPLGITGFLDQHRLNAPALAEQLLLTGQLSTALSNPAMFGAFDTMTAASRMLKEAGAFGLEMNDTLSQLMTGSVADGVGLHDYRKLLDSAGLHLPRWPRFRSFTTAEQAERQRRRLAQHKQPRHRASAQSLVYQHESYLRDAIDELMAAEYGDDWAEERLRKCGELGFALLARWRDRGGMPLDHADYPHYRAIITQDEHFESIFSVAFSDTSVAVDLINRARSLRAASHHPGPEFTTDDLRDLRLTWNAIMKAFRQFQAGILWEDAVH